MMGTDTFDKIDTNELKETVENDGREDGVVVTS